MAQQSGLSREEMPHFSFGTSHSSRGGSRRLFAPQKQLLAPVFASQTERPRAILRVVSGGA